VNKIFPAVAILAVHGMAANEAISRECNVTTKSAPQAIISCIKELDRRSVGAAPLPYNVPIGTIVAYAGSIEAPGAKEILKAQGWIPCDGDDAPADKYPELCRAIGSFYGKSTITDHCKLPNLQGQFLRGLDSSGAIDPKRLLGSPQSFATALPNKEFAISESGKHSHDLPKKAFWSGGTGPSGFLLDVKSGFIPGEGIGESGNHSHVIRGGGDEETRPVNVAVNFLIRAK